MPEHWVIVNAEGIRSHTYDCPGCAFAEVEEERDRYRDTLRAAQEELRLSVPAIPVHCLLSSLSELWAPIGYPKTKPQILDHVRNAVAEYRAALAEDSSV